MTGEEPDSGAEPDAGRQSEPEGSEALASVVHVDRQEDIATICGRVDAAPSYAVVLHAPGGNRALAEEIGMRRLVRHAEESGKTIAIATKKGALAGRARSVGVPVARKPQHIRWNAGGRVIWGLGRRSIAVPAIGRFLPAITLAIAAVVLVGLAFTMGPSADVVVYPPSETLEQVVTITASESFDEVNLEDLEVPATTVQSSRLVTLAIPTTGSAEVGVTPAQVTVSLTNGGDEEIAIPAGTIVETSNEELQFETAEDLTLIPAETGYVAGTAIQPGIIGNIEPGTVTGLADEAFQSVTATNAGNGAGGADEPRPAVASEDIVSLRETAGLLETADAIRDSIIEDRPGDAIFLDTASVEVIEGEPSGSPGTPAEVVTMDVRIGVTALGVVESVLDRIARATLTPEAATGEFISGSVSAVETGARQVDSESGAITTDFRLRGEFARGATTQEIKEAISGQSTDDARSTLQERYGIDEAEIDVWPGWAPRLPRFDFRIDVQFQSQPENELQPQSSAGDDEEPDPTPSAGT